MKKLIISGLSLTLSCILFISCNNNRSVEFERIGFTKVIKSSLSTDTTNGHCCVDLLLLYPSNFGEKEALKNIQQQILTYAFDSTYAKYTGKQAVDSFATRTFDDYTYFINEAARRHIIKGNRAVLHNEHWEMTTMVLYNDKGILSYELDRYSFAGGAHGMEATQYLVFDLKTGKKIKEQDIFEEGFEPKIIDLLKKQIMFDNGFESEEQMLNNGYFAAENIRPNGNFYISEEGITYIFNPYEIGAYSLGATEVTIPFRKIRSALKANSPIQKVIAAAPQEKEEQK